MLMVAPTEGYDSLVSLAFADSYHGSMAVTAWAAATVDAREAALRRGTQYIMGRQVKPQYLTPVHQKVMAATAEAALRALDGSLYQDIDAQSVRSESVGPVSVTYSFPRNGGRKGFPVIDDLLYGLTAGGGRVEVVRA